MTRGVLPRLPFSFPPLMTCSEGAVSEPTSTPPPIVTGCVEMTGRSIGVGFEAGWLLGRGRPVLVLYDADVAPASTVVRFPPFDHCVSFGYRDLMDVSGAVTDFCRTIAAHAAYRAEG